ncbi:MAG: chemotaxis protein CheA [Polyangiales bacterium]
MSAVDLKEFIGAFLAEADEHLAAANTHLLSMETSVRKGESTARAVRELFRALHTIKGLSAMVGVEPIVAIAHRMETVLRAADRAGGVVPDGAIDVLLRGVRAIEQLVRALGAGQPVTAPPQSLLDALESLEPVVLAPTAADLPSLELDPAIASKLTASEREQLVRGVVEGRRAVRVDFRPSPARSAAGSTINSVRERIGAIAEIVRVLPQMTPASAEALAGLSFAIVVLTAATDAQLELAADSDPGQLWVLAEPADLVAPMSEALPEVEEGATDAYEPRTNVLRVEVARIDDAMERLAALIVTRSRLARAVAMLAEAGTPSRDLVQVLTDQTRQLRDLRKSILRVRMVRMAEVLDRVPLIVRGLCRASGKLVRLQMDLGGTELDKAVADRIFPALVHLVRNAIDHGIESPAARSAAGKPEEGTLRILCAEHSSSRLEIEVSDDGDGIDRASVARHAHADTPETDVALLDMLCRPGVSTRDEVTTTSGRGMGMDIVRRIVVDQLAGELELSSTRGAGTRFVLRVPLTVSIVDAFTLECSGQRFVVPVSMVEELIDIDPAKVIYGPIAVTGAERRGVGMLQRRGEAVPLIELATALRLGRPKERARKALIVRRAGEPMAFGLDRVIGQQEAVVRPLEDPLVRVQGISGATDLGDGRPTLVLDLVTLSARLGVLRQDEVAA